MKYPQTEKAILRTTNNRKDNGALVPFAYENISRKENMFEKLKKLWQRRKLDRDFRRRGIVGGKSRKTKDNAIVLAADKSPVLGIFLLLLLWGAGAFMLIYPFEVPRHQDIIKNKPAPRSIFSEFDFNYTSAIATEEARKNAKANTPLYYSVDSNATNTMRRRFDDFFNAVIDRAVREKEFEESAPENKGRFQYTPSNNIPFSKEVAELSLEDFMLLRNLLSDEKSKSDFEREKDFLIYSGLFNTNEKNSKSVGKKIIITDPAKRRHPPKAIDDINSVEQASRILANKISGTLSIRRTLHKLFGSTGNLTFDKASTDAAMAAAAAEINDVVVEVKRDTPVITKNANVDDELFERYTAYTRQQKTPAIELKKIFKSLFTSLMLVVFVGFYMYHIHTEIIKSNKKLALLGFTTIFSLALNYAVIKLYMFGAGYLQLPQQFMLYFSPYTIASVILAVTLGFRVALYMGFFVASLLALMNGGGFEFAFLAMVSCSLSALAVRNSQNYRSFFFWTVIPVWLTGFICFLPNIQTEKLLETTLWGLAISLMNGFLTAIVAMMMIFLLELLFNTTTNMSLLLLINGHPLLERLKREAPGTYFHSMMVATLAEDAAKAIDANSVHAKCGALYHDIGKLAMPQYFTENNLENDNQHIDLNPNVSSIIIRDHVKEGLALAKKYKLNRVIRNAINQHHGNDLVHYFYNRAMLESKNGTVVDESKFRYQGDLPRNKEMVIISLADACEAAVRSLEKPSVQKIEMMIDEIFKKRFRDNQLDQACITLDELHKVRESFVTNLISMRHGRIAYHKDENSGNEDESDLFMANAGEQTQTESGKNQEIH